MSLFTLGSVQSLDSTDSRQFTMKVPHQTLSSPSSSPSLIIIITISIIAYAGGYVGCTAEAAAADIPTHCGVWPGGRPVPAPGLPSQLGNCAGQACPGIERVLVAVCVLVDGLGATHVRIPRYSCLLVGTPPGGSCHVSRPSPGEKPHKFVVWKMVCQCSQMTGGRDVQSLHGHGTRRSESRCESYIHISRPL